MGDVVEVYRYEDHRQLGPYQGLSAVSEEIRDVHNQRNGHPGAWDDFQVYPYGGEIFGCPSEEKLDEWFDEYHYDLQEAGYLRVLYLVPTKDAVVSISGKQVMFDSKNSLREVLPEF